MNGTATIEADDEDEAQELAEDALRDHTTYNFENFDTEEVEIESVRQVGKDE